MLNFKLLGLFLLTSFLSFTQLEEYKRRTETLCSPSFHGRGYVNKGDSIAADFIASEFGKIGLKAFKKSYFQYFNLAVNSFPELVQIKLGDNKLIAGQDFLISPESGSYDNTINVRELSVDEILNESSFKTEVKSILNKKSNYNAILFNSVNIGSDTNRLVQSTLSQLLDLMPIVIVTNHKFTWSVGRHQYKFPLIELQESAYVPNQIMYVQIDAKFIPNYQSQNVIGYLPSKKRRAETVVVTAHYDHLGSMGKDAYFPGANDNASGTAMLLLVADYFKQHPVDKNILFIAFGAEEAGLVGSRYFVNNPTYKLKKIDFVLNIDIMGSGDEGITVVNAIEQEKAFELLQKINEEKQLLTLIKKRGQTQNSDHYWFSHNQIPAIFIYTQGSNKNYHDINDVYENLKMDKVLDIRQLFVDFIERY